MSDYNFYNFLKPAREREQHARELRQARQEIDMLKREKAVLEAERETILKAWTKVHDQLVGKADIPNVNMYLTRLYFTIKELID